MDLKIIKETIKEITDKELMDLKEMIQKEIEKRSKYKVIVLEYNDYKGKTWIARVNPETLKIEEFLKAASKVNFGKKYVGEKRYKIPLVEGIIYAIQELGHRKYYKVTNGKLVVHK